MPAVHEHLERARQNEKLADALNLSSGVCVDWAVTILFYAGLHFIDGFLATKGCRPHNHKERDIEVENNGSLAPIFEAYRRLKDLSREARYEIPNYPKEKIGIAKNRLAQIKSHLGY